MFYILSENRALVPYEYSPAVKRLNNIVGADAVQKHEERPDSERKKESHGKNAKVIHSYESQMEENISAHPLTVESIMTKNPVSFAESISVPEARMIAEKNAHQHFPVTSPTGEIVGSISESSLKATQFPKISDAMETRVVVVHPRASLRELAGIMLHEGIHCLPVVTEDRHLVGIVTTTDILKAMLTRASVEFWS